MSQAPPARPGPVLPAFIIVAGVTLLVASRLEGPLAVNTVGLTVLSAGIALVALGSAALLLDRERTRGFVATAGVVLATIPLGLAVHHSLLLPRGLDLPLLLALFASGSVLVAAGALVAGRVAPLTPSTVTLTTAAVAGGLVGIGTFLPWLRGGQLSQSGLALGTGIGVVVLILGVITALAVGALAVVRSDRVRVVGALAGGATAGIAAVMSTHAGVLIDSGAAFGLLVTVVASVVALAAIVATLLESMGLPRPSPQTWVWVLFIAFGILGFVLGYALEDRLEDLGGNVAVMRISSSFLLVAGVAMATGQTWGWLLGFPVAIAGVINGIVVVIRTGNRGFGLLAAVIYANALRALWQGRGAFPAEVTTDTAAAPPPRPDVLPEPSRPPAGPPPVPTQPFASPPGIGPSFGRPPGEMRPPAPPRPPAPGLDPRPVPSLALSLEELPEQRTWRSDPALQEVLEPLNRRDYGAAAAAAEVLETRFLDLDLLYSWWGKALLEQGDVGAARDVLRRGIARSRRKYVLAERLGEAAWKAGDLEDAVAWWARSVRSQEGLGATGEVGPYLYLHSVALGMGLYDVAGSLLDRIDRMRPGQIRLEESVAAELRRLAASRGGPEVSTLLRELTEPHAGPTVPAVSGAAPAAPAQAPPSAPPATVPVPAPGPGRWDARRIGIVAALGVLLLGGGITLGTVLSGDDDDFALPAAERPSVQTLPPFGGDPTPDGPQEVLAETVDCLEGKGFAVGAPISDRGGRAVVFTADDGTTVTVIEFPTEEDAMAAHREAVEAVTPGEGYIYTAGRIVMLFAPAPTDTLRGLVEPCVPLI